MGLRARKELVCPNCNVLLDKWPNNYPGATCRKNKDQEWCGRNFCSMCFWELEECTCPKIGVS